MSIFKATNRAKTSGSRAFCRQFVRKLCIWWYRNVFSHIPAGANTDKAKKEIPCFAFQSGSGLTGFKGTPGDFSTFSLEQNSPGQEFSPQRLRR